MSRECPRCKRELEILHWIIPTGRLVCPKCHEILFTEKELSDMCFFERKINFCDVEIIERNEAPR